MHIASHTWRDGPGKMSCRIEARIDGTVIMKICEIGSPSRSVNVITASRELQLLACIQTPPSTSRQAHFPAATAVPLRLMLSLPTSGVQIPTSKIVIVSFRSFL